MNDGSALPTLQVNEREAEERDTQFTVRGVKKKQLGKNELRYVAWGACLYDSISTLRDGMRCTESKLTFLCCKNKSHVLSSVLSVVLTCVERTEPRTPFGKRDIQQLFAYW